MNWLPAFSPASQIVVLALSTFAQEDAPTIGAALLTVSGRMSLWIAYLGCFLGIWVGDMLLYGAARLFGRSALQKNWLARFVKPELIARSEQWFHTRGTWILPMSRLVPGTRLPTYLAAGFLGFPFDKFFWVTGVSVAIWTAGIFVAASILGKFVLAGLLKNLLLLTLCVTLLFCLQKMTTRFLKISNLTLLLGKWSRWEFWPAWLFYPPVVVYYIYLSARHRSFTLPTAANPGIFAGGIVGESKMETLRHLLDSAPEFTAASWEISESDPNSRVQRFNQIIESETLSFPVVLKPDVGQRGIGVKVILNAEHAHRYLQSTSVRMVLQCHIPGPHELGIFYVRRPHETHGHILAITEKHFPSVTGDGIRSIAELIAADCRASLIADTYLARFKSIQSRVLEKGQVLKLVEAGNHAQGCIFKDGMHLWTEELEKAIDSISMKVPGFFIGRYDLRYSDPTQLGRGLDFQIVELNGAASEITSIYDSKNSLVSAYRTLCHQWKLVVEIGAANRGRGIRPMKAQDLWKAWKSFQLSSLNLPAAD